MGDRYIRFAHSGTRRYNTACVLDTETMRYVRFLTDNTADDFAKRANRGETKLDDVPFVYDLGPGDVIEIDGQEYEIK